MFPSITGCMLFWTGDEQVTSLEGLFYNEILSSYRIVDREKFESGKLKFTFRCEE